MQQREVLVDDVKGEMRTGVGEGRDADHAADGDELRIARAAHQRRHQERQGQEPDRP